MHTQSLIHMKMCMYVVESMSLCIALCMPDIDWRSDIMPVENPQTQSLLAQVQCSRGNPCQCVIDKFSTLTDNGFVHEVTQNGPIIHGFLNPEKRLTAFDILRGFTNDSITYALPVNTLSKRVEYNCSSDILTVITSPGGESRDIPLPNECYSGHV